MAVKLDTDKPLFLGNTPVREATTFGAIRKAVHELDKGEGVSYADLEKHLLENFAPPKSANYNGSYIKSYVRDAVNRLGHLSHENIGAEYTVTAPAPEKEAAAPKPKKVTKADIARNDVLAFVRDKGEVADQSDIDSTKITTETLVTETKRKQKTIDKQVAELAEAGFVRTEQVEGSTYVFLTAAGLDHVNEVAPVVAGDSAAAELPEGTAAETTEEVDDSEA